MYACMYVCMYVCMYATYSMYICMYACLCVCRYIARNLIYHSLLCVYACMYVCIYFMYVHTHVCITKDITRFTKRNKIIIVKIIPKKSRSCSKWVGNHTSTLTTFCLQLVVILPNFETFISKRINTRIRKFPNDLFLISFNASSRKVLLAGP